MTTYSCCVLSPAEVCSRDLKVPKLQGNHAVEFLLFELVSEILRKSCHKHTRTLMHKGMHTDIPETALSAAKPHVQPSLELPRPFVEKTILLHHVKIHKVPAILTQGTPNSKCLPF